MGNFWGKKIQNLFGRNKCSQKKKKKKKKKRKEEKESNKQNKTKKQGTEFSAIYQN